MGGKHPAYAPDGAWPGLPFMKRGGKEYSSHSLLLSFLPFPSFLYPISFSPLLPLEEKPI